MKHTYPVVEKLLSRLAKRVIRLLLFLRVSFPLCLYILKTIARHTIDANLPGSHAKPQFLGSMALSVIDVTLKIKKLADVIVGAAGVSKLTLLKNGIPNTTTQSQRKRSIRHKHVMILSAVGIIDIPMVPIKRHANIEYANILYNMTKSYSVPNAN